MKLEDRDGLIPFHGCSLEKKTDKLQWLFLVPLIGGRYHIIPQLAVYTNYIPLIYCQLGDYMVPTSH